ncbi:PssE/Cps14G family polysaccharide biosynthesis glycosyltransferase [Colwellia sp. 1_MG-2023]|uniref:PssE/Cps14G family polysaccharide biosynthesis glycosyltransferase n=1 Tax=Colwellia sp. 1_MG-2023 TaxID=3062649 RepID=UPI0026E473D1|nr:PssE/Cps14G family polysaccharide biosynthesis glycosyltransferase [Colwellia sp. 1_MG-2023]MDO6444313.1 PssE/Cps14G family polysaccharide biosynthesis glycosyltransferase [Colwellia sp. 1_MG-2023]
MNIFVTVGHTHYNALFKAVNEQLSSKKYHIVNQISEGTYLPVNHTYFKYTTQVQDEVNKADLVITHAGAGSVFNLLEMAKPTLIVPNFDRIDNHQQDLADFVIKNNYACVCTDLQRLEEFVLKSVNNQFTPYQKNNFCGYEKILEVINEA